MELAPGIVSLGGKAGGYVRAFLIADGSALTLVDTLADDHPHEILAGVRRLGYAISDLKTIIVTHAHYSHLKGLAALQRLSGATVYAHEWEADIVAGERKAQRVSIVPRPPLRAYIPFQLGLALGLGDHVPCPVDDVLRDGQNLGRLSVVHAPGHTPGHLAFWIDEERLLLAGDAIVTWPSLAAGWDSFTLNEPQHRESVRRLVELEPRAVGVGHGDPLVGDVAERVDSLI